MHRRKRAGGADLAAPSSMIDPCALEEVAEEGEQKKEKKKKEPPVISYKLMRNMRQNVGIEDEIIVGWALDQSNNKDLPIIYLVGCGTLRLLQRGVMCPALIVR